MLLDKDPSKWPSPLLVGAGQAAESATPALTSLQAARISARLGPFQSLNLIRSFLLMQLRMKPSCMSSPVVGSTHHCFTSAFGMSRLTRSLLIPQQQLHELKDSNPKDLFKK